MTYPLHLAPAHPDNWRPGRGGLHPCAIVIHRMDATISSAKAWFAAGQAARQGRGPSAAHYGIGLDGRRERYVEEADTAFHCGATGSAILGAHYPWAWPGLNLNTVTIGIEHEGSGRQPWTDEMIHSSAELIADIARRYAFEISRTTVVPHNALKPTACPGPVCPLDQIIGLARAARERLDQPPESTARATTAPVDTVAVAALRTAVDAYAAALLEGRADPARWRSVETAWEALRGG